MVKVWALLGVGQWFAGAGSGAVGGANGHKLSARVRQGARQIIAQGMAAEP